MLTDRFNAIPTLVAALLTLAPGLRPAAGQTIPTARESRAAWVTTVWGLDWPSSSSNPTQQRQELRDTIDFLKAANFNTIILQVRARADAIYPSTFEPWSLVFTGDWGQDPGWDPLAFAVDYARQRGMAIHAWINFGTIAKGAGTYLPPEGLSPPHLLYTHPDWLYRIGADGDYYLNAGLPDARAYTREVVVDLVNNYDLDGIVFDYIRYATSIAAQDWQTYLDYHEGAITLRAWREQNISDFLSDTYAAVKALKPWVRVGAAPIRRSFQAYQDYAAWMTSGAVDYLAPLIYLTNNDVFSDTLATRLAETGGRYVYPILGIYKMLSSQEDAAPGVFLEQVDISRALGGNGQGYFRSRFLTDNLKNFTSLLRASRYANPVHPPAMPWLDDDPPNPPQSLTIGTLDTNRFRLSWSSPQPVPDGDPPRYYDVYRAPESPPDIANPAHRIAIISADSLGYTDYIAQTADSIFYYTVTALDRGHTESDPAAPVMVRAIPNVSPGGVTAVPELMAVTEAPDGRIAVGWRPNREPHLGGYRLYLSFDGANWSVYNRNPIEKTATSVVLEPGTDAEVYFRLTSIDDAPEHYESPASDTYGISREGDLRVLVVDGFDRTTGSYTDSTHAFAVTYGQALAAGHAAFASCASEAVGAGLVELTGYDAVVWFLGDESAPDTTIAPNEQAALAGYLEAGGSLLVSGSDVARSLDVLCEDSDRAFLHEYLKGASASEEQGVNRSVTGWSNTHFQGKQYDLDDGTHGTYDEVRPDIIVPANGGEVIMQYAQGKAAGVSYAGTFGPGQETGRVLFLAFAFETIYDSSQRRDFMARVLAFFQGLPVSVASPETPRLVGDFRLYQSLPNPVRLSAAVSAGPSDARASIAFTLPVPADVRITLYNALGQEVRHLLTASRSAGLHRVSVSLRGLAPGTYFYRMEARVMGRLRFLDSKRMSVVR